MEPTNSYIKGAADFAAGRYQRGRGACYLAGYHAAREWSRDRYELPAAAPVLDLYRAWRTRQRRPMVRP